MADSTIPNLVAVSVPALTDLLGVRQSGDSRDKKLTVTQLLSLASGGGDVTKVGTPVDDQLGVWTGDGTIEGLASLRYSSSLELFADSIVLGDLESVKIRETLVNTIAFRFSNNDRWRMNNDSFATSVSDGAFLKRTGVSGSVPSLVPRSGDENTGIGSAASDQISIVAGGVVAISVVEAGAAIITSLVGVTRGTSANAFALINENASATNPTLTPNRAEDDTGIGSNASDEVSLIGGGVELARAVAPASGGLLANNTVTGAGIERVLTTADLSGGGGDVTKVGTPVDNQIGIWTGDGTIEGDAQFLWDGSALTVGFTNAGPQLLNEVATDTNPTIVPTRNDPDTGIGHDAADRFALIAGGVTVAHVQESSGHPALILDPNDAGTGAPELAFGAGADTGFRESGNVLTLILGGASKFAWDSDLFVSSVATGAGMLNEAVSATNPTFVPNRSDLDSGIGQNAADQVSIIAGGVEIARAVEAAVEQFIISPGAILGSAALPSLAFGDGDSGIRESVDDALKVTLAGVDRWTFTADRLVGVAGNSPSLQNEGSTATNPTMIPALGDPSTGIGGVTTNLSLIVGGAERIHLDTTLSVGNTFTGDWKAANSTGPIMVDEAASGVNPTLVPRRGDEDTGVGSLGLDTLSLIAGGVEMLRLSEGTTDQVFIGPAGTAAAPSLSFVVDPDTGFYSAVPGILAVSVDGTGRFRFVGNQFRGAVGGSPSIQNEVASATNPTLLPSQTDLDTGIGRTGTDQLALVAGGLDCMTVRETGSARQIGFYVTAPISLQTGVAVTDVAIHAALVALGLITA